MTRAFLLIALWTVCTAAGARVEITNLRMWPAPDHTRVVFDVDGPLEHSVFVLKSPERVVVDLRDTSLTRKIARPDKSDRLLRRIRSATRGKRDLRVVLDMKQSTRPRSFLLKPSGGYGHRLVVDLYASTDAAARAPVKRIEEGSDALRDVVIAIDAGHGGEDPGAIGAMGTREKEVVLAVARQLETLVRAERGMRPVMLRKGDYYVGLRRRTEIARGHRADVMVSIHADAFRDPQVRGTAVYILSRNGASSEAARWLAAQENAADLAGGVSLDDKDELLASVLLDLSQTATLSASTEVGTRVLSELKALGKVHKRRVERAGFMVLKSPDIPSILVETAFITNPEEERRLRDPSHQRAVAGAILRGIRTYFDRSAPPGTLLAARRHLIAKGDTLSDIAARYRVSLGRLRTENKLIDNSIREGEILRIPHPTDG
jgi:N-acetylmuramoyl-L-alanine amidase